MPTLNPRITVTLSPEQHSLLREMSRLTQTSQSGLISQILTELTPVWSKMLTLMAAAEQAKGVINESFIQDMDKAQAKVEKQLGLAIDAMDDFNLPILALAEKVEHRKGRDSARTRRHADAGAAAAGTPLSNRGVRSNNKQTKSTTYAAQPKITTPSRNKTTTVQKPSTKPNKKGVKK
jgi:hypothetical protein